MNESVQQALQAYFNYRRLNVAVEKALKDYTCLRDQLNVRDAITLNALTMNEGQIEPISDELLARVLTGLKSLV